MNKNNTILGHLAEKERIDVLNNMFVLLEKFDTNPKIQLIMAGDFILFFDSKFDAQGGSPTIKKKYLAKLIELKDIINPHSCLLKNANFSIKTSND